MGDKLEAGSITLRVDGGDEIEAYAAHPIDQQRSGGVVVIHHMPGYDAATKEITRRFAAWGWSAACPNLHHRFAPGAAFDDAAAAARAAGGVQDDQLIADVASAAAYLRGHASSNGAVGTIGFCSGGRQSVLAGCALDIDAVVDCYGAFVLSSTEPDSPLQMQSLEDRLPQLTAPVLGLFGLEDKHPSPDEVEQLDKLLTELGVEHDFHSFEDAGHAFFGVDRPGYRQAAATEGWVLVRDFFTRKLCGQESS